jgi:hypothetical protein
MLAALFAISSAHDPRGPAIALGLSAALAFAAAVFSGLRVNAGRE